MFSRSGRERGISLPQRPNFRPTLLRSARKSKSLRTTTQLRPPATHAFSVDSTLLKFAISANNTFLRVCALCAKCRGVCPESETPAKPCGTGFSSPLTPVVSALTDVQIPRDLKCSRINTYAKPPGVRLPPRIGLQRAWANGTMARTLVIQLGRLGDVIQTTPLLADLDAIGDEVDVLVLRSAHEPLIGFSAVANIITISDSLKPLDDAIACGFPNGKIPVEAHELLAETSIHPPSNTAAGDPLGGLMYHPLHRNAVTSDELFAQYLRQAFAVEFVIPTDTSALKESDSYAIDSLTQIFEHMETLAISCAESTRTRAASIEISNAAHALIATMEKLHALVAEAEWRRFSPVLHNLDWHLRMSAPQSGERTFLAHADAYASAVRVLRRANRMGGVDAKGWSRRRFASTS